MPSRSRRRRGQQPDLLVDRRGRPVIPWKWLTFPVYFAGAVGLFAGFNLGSLAPHLNAKLENVASLVIAILFAFALSQLATRPLAEMMLRRRTRQQAQRRPCAGSPDE